MAKCQHWSRVDLGLEGAVKHLSLWSATGISQEARPGPAELSRPFPSPAAPLWLPRFSSLLVFGDPLNGESDQGVDEYQEDLSAV